MNKKVGLEKKAGAGLSVMFIFVLLILIININLIIAQETSNNKFDENQAITWPENLEKMEGISSDKKNEVWNSASGYVRGYVIKQVSSDIRNQKITEVKQTNTLRNLAGISLLEVPPELKITGFENQKLKWEDKLVIGDSNVQIDLKKIPLNVEEVEYKYDETSGYGMFIYKDKNRNVIKIAKGSVNENLELIGVEGYENFKFILEKNQEISFFPEGLNPEGFYLKNGAKLQFEGITVSQTSLDKDGFFSFKESNHFTASGVKIETPTADIEVPFKITDVFLRTPSTDDKSTQGVWLYTKYIQTIKIKPGEVGIVEDRKVDNAKLVGEGINLKLKKDFSLIEGDGENLKIINGELITEIKGKQTLSNRNNFNGEFNVENIRNLQGKEYNVETEVKHAEVKPEVKPEETKPIEVKSEKKPKETKPTEVKPETVTETPKPTPSTTNVGYKEKDYVQLSFRAEEEKRAGKIMFMITGVDKESFQNLPLGLSKTEFKKRLEAMPKKVEMIAALYVPTGRSEYPTLWGDDIDDAIFNEKNGKIPLARENDPDYPFNNNDEKILRTVIAKALLYKDENGESQWRVFPTGSKIYFTTGKNPSIELKINQNDPVTYTSWGATYVKYAETLNNANYGANVKPPIIIKDSNQIRVINKYFNYVINSEDPKMPGYNSRAGIRTPLDVIYTEVYPRKSQCPICFQKNKKLDFAPGKGFEY